MQAAHLLGERRKSILPAARIIILTRGRDSSMCSRLITGGSLNSSIEVSRAPVCFFFEPWRIQIALETEIGPGTDGRSCDPTFVAKEQVIGGESGCGAEGRKIWYTWTDEMQECVSVTSWRWDEFYTSDRSWGLHQIVCNATWRITSHYARTSDDLARERSRAFDLHNHCPMERRISFFSFGA